MYSNECIYAKDSVFCPRYLVYFNLHLGQFLVQNTKNTYLHTLKEKIIFSKLLDGYNSK